jgi:hypothetical protein
MLHGQKIAVVSVTLTKHTHTLGGHNREQMWWYPTKPLGFKRLNKKQFCPQFVFTLFCDPQKKAIIYSKAFNSLDLTMAIHSVLCEVETEFINIIWTKSDLKMANYNKYLSHYNINLWNNVKYILSKKKSSSSVRILLEFN